MENSKARCITLFYREEFEKIEAFTSKLPFESWNCCKLQMLNRPLAPVLVFLFKR